MLLGMGLSWVIPERLIGLFTDSAETIEIGRTALHRISLGFAISAISITCSGALEGLGKGFSSLLISMMRYVLVIMPAAYLLSRVMGANGVWLAFAFTEFVTALAAALIYRRETKISPQKKIQL